ncbi:MAG: hypothetical protein ACLVAW_23075 [Eisenbergiella massiliensis]
MNSFELMNIVSAFEEYFDTTIPPGTSGSCIR